MIIVSVITSTVVFLIATIFKKQYVKNEDFVQRINNYLDAAGLGVFVISGARICMEAGFTNPFLIVVMGMLSGTGGSMTRDIIMREVPALLRKHIYLMAALAGATIYYFLVRFGVSNVFAVPIGVTSIVVIRLLATAFKWNMPKAIDFTKLGEEHK